MRAGIVVALGFALCACSVITSGPQNPSPNCVLAEGRDPCVDLPGGAFRCAFPDGAEIGVCQPSVCADIDVCGNAVDDDCDGMVDNGSLEICNGIDDDCDITVDEDLDEDGDGYTWCPTGPTLRDCDDSNDAVYPGRGSDACDGLDNDCDPATPDGTECRGDQDCDALRGCIDVNCTTRPGLCAADQFCDASSMPPSCRLADMTCLGSMPCPSGAVCNPATAECVTPQANGIPCDYDAECVSHLCVPIPALRMIAAHVMDRNGLCSRSCCSNVDCSATETCWASGSGAKACVPTSLLEMGSNGAPGSTTCALRRECPDECRLTFDDAYEVRDRLSMSCGSPYVSSRACDNDFDCPLFSGSPCLDGRCGYQSCFSVEECPSGLCAGGRCRDTCASAGDCPTSRRLGTPACLFVVGRSPAGRDDFLPACSYASSGTGSGGSPCTSDNDCRDRTCVDHTGNPLPASGAQMFCADTCCAEATCKAGDQCRPIFVHGHWENHCLPEPVFSRGGPGG